MDQYNVLVGAVVIVGDSVLVLQRSRSETFLPGHWGIPAGKAQYGEQMGDAALRELREEAGIVGSIDKPTGCTWFESNFNESSIRNVQFNFRVQATSRMVKLDSSNQNYRWLGLHELDDPPIPLDEFTRKTICEALGDTLTTSNSTDT